MSEMSFVAAVRFKQPNITRDHTLLDKLNSIFGKEPDEVDESDGFIDYVRYEPKNNNGFTATLMNKDILYIDYILDESNECYDINLDISRDRLSSILDQASKLGIDASDYKIKVLYYYNGGCAGLSEVE